MSSTKASIAGLGDTAGAISAQDSVAVYPSAPVTTTAAGSRGFVWPGFCLASATRS
ncbi:hypothetical protein C6A87_021825 [Mycobacterium sp. ITM-2016-00317]|uniref:hypothetical protein n=1 Tax=Mycobacterium sp. ITM-2016-00317 TaxID=2099694 RepID=UPI00287F8BD0|nr:hypothetical protein [Mycobacterium sp. ITM-2016-00317]WNG86455.1 hypothetical protein C6A87_021825 [Mycobacterium sp. ITM-2016-00317]